MAYSNPYLNEYRKTAVNSASPLQLVVMLYDGALRHLHAGCVAMESKNYFEQNASFTKAQKVLSELMACLDMQKGGEVAHQLMALYTYCYNQIVEANIEDDPAKVRNCEHVLRELRESWVKLESDWRAGKLSVPMEQAEVADAA